MRRKVNKTPTASLFLMPLEFIFSFDFIQLHDNDPNVTRFLYHAILGCHEARSLQEKKQLISFMLNCLWSQFIGIAKSCYYEALHRMQWGKKTICRQPNKKAPIQYRSQMNRTSNCNEWFFGERVHIELIIVMLWTIIEWLNWNMRSFQCALFTQITSTQNNQIYLPNYMRFGALFL